MAPRGRGVRWAGGGVIAAAGFFALLSQTLLFRSFLSVCEGHEIAVGLFFAAWLGWVGIGGVAGRFAGCRGVAHPEIILLLYPLAHGAQALLIAQGQFVTGAESYELVTPGRLALFAAVATGSVPLLTGLFFTSACEWASRAAGAAASRVYALEAAGGLAGGMLATWAGAVGVGAEASAIAGGAVCWGALVAASAARRDLKLALTAGAALALAVAAAGAGGYRAWAHWSDARTWGRFFLGPPAGRLQTPQGVYVYGVTGRSLAVVSQNHVTDEIPGTDAHAELAALHVAQKPGARSVLVIGGSGLALGMELLRWEGSRTITWLSSDPDYAPALLGIAGDRLGAFRGSLVCPGRDPRRSLEQRAERYDLIIVNVSDPTSLGLSRYFTREFIQAAAARLEPGGVLSLRVAGGENFLGPSLAGIGASVHGTLAGVFSFVAMKPGDDTWLFASEVEGVVSESPGVLVERLKGLGPRDGVYPAEGLFALFPQDRIRRQRDLYAQAFTPDLVNTDRRPPALLFALLLESEKAGGWLLGRLVGILRTNGLFLPLSLVIAFLAARWMEERKNGRRRRETEGNRSRFESAMLLFVTGAQGMAMTLLLMFLFQSRYGTLFLDAGLMSAMVMGGLFAGAWGAERAVRRIPEGDRRVLAVLMAVQAAGCLALAVAGTGDAGRAGYAMLFLGAGILTGGYVPPVARRLRGAGCDPASDRAAGSVVESMDTWGGAAGGFLAGTLLIPVLGTSGAAVVIAACVAVNLPALVRGRGRETGSGVWARRAAYAVAAGAWVLCANAWVYGIRRPPQVGPTLRSVAAAMIAPESCRVGDAGSDTARFVEVHSKDGEPRGSVYDTGAYAAGVVGYGGPLSVAVWEGVDGRIRKVSLLRSRETPGYLALLSEWWGRFGGAEPRDLKGIDTVSGATVTSRAVIEAVRRGGAAFVARHGADPASAADSRTKVPVDWRSFALAALAICAVAARRMTGPLAGGLRLGLLVCAAAGFGLLLNMQYSMHHVGVLLKGQLPPAGWTVAFAVTVGVAVLTLLAGNVYCGFLCPFGACQELAQRVTGSRWTVRPAPGVTAWLRLVKFGILAVLAAAVLSGVDAWVVGGDPLVTLFGRAGEPWTWGVGLLALAAATVVGRAWCRYVCPAGAFLSVLSRAGRLLRRDPAVVPARCPYGIADGRQWDCLCCDRCRGAVVNLEGGAGEVLRKRVSLVLVIAVLVGAMWVVKPVAEHVSQSRNSHAEVAGAGASRPIDMRALQRAIEEGRLSGHEALYYKAAGADPGATSVR